MQILNIQLWGERLSYVSAIQFKVKNEEKRILRVISVS